MYILCSNYFENEKQFGGQRVTYLSIKLHSFVCYSPIDVNIIADTLNNAP